MRTMLKSKIHRARVTSVNVAYEGSITIDPLLMKAADMLPYEMVYVLNVNNGARFETYVIEGEEGSGTVAINGAAGRLVAADDIVIILSYHSISDTGARIIEPTLVYVDAQNSITKKKDGNNWMKEIELSFQTPLS
jgi:aspartate 1-decarboxylase